MAAFLRKIPASNLHVSKPTWWLESRFHFSFADYYNPQNTNFGPLRVLNDDLVKPKSGFGAHPHRNAEIFSYVVKGELTHADSIGNKESLGRGQVQYLSAGTGIVHSEMNDGDKTCRFLQVWITPDRSGHQPQYGSSRYTNTDRKNTLLHILGGTGTLPKWNNITEGKCINLHQDCNVFVSESDADMTFDITLPSGRQAYVVCIEGAMSVAASDSSCGDIEHKLQERDAAELGPAEGGGGKKTLYVTLKPQGPQGAHFMLVEMKS
jgi:quercetin 2,3-dioxygenase